MADTDMMADDWLLTITISPLHSAGDKSKSDWQIFWDRFTKHSSGKYHWNSYYIQHCFTVAVLCADEKCSKKRLEAWLVDCYTGPLTRGTWIRFEVHHYMLETNNTVIVTNTQIQILDQYPQTYNNIIWKL